MQGKLFSFAPPQTMPNYICTWETYGRVYAGTVGVTKIGTMLPNLYPVNIDKFYIKLPIQLPLK